MKKYLHQKYLALLDYFGVEQHYPATAFDAYSAAHDFVWTWIPQLSAELLSTESVESICLTHRQPRISSVQLCYDRSGLEAQDLMYIKTPDGRQYLAIRLEATLMQGTENIKRSLEFGIRRSSFDPDFIGRGVYGCHFEADGLAELIDHPNGDPAQVIVKRQGQFTVYIQPRRGRKIDLIQFNSLLNSPDWRP